MAKAKKTSKQSTRKSTGRRISENDLKQVAGGSTGTLLARSGYKAGVRTGIKVGIKGYQEL
jgi:hypothetical protein